MSVMDQNNIPQNFFIVAYIILIWTIIWKGIALWRAAKYGQRNWFISILVLNPPVFTTLGILEIVYLFRFAKKRMTILEIKSGFKKLFIQTPK